MADETFEQPPVSTDDTNVTATGNKRKRSSLEEHQGRAAPGFDKDMGYVSNTDEGMGLTDAEFTALTQHNNADAPPHSNGVNGVRDASDTAAAAMSAYNNMTVPPPTELNFQPANASPEQNASFGLGGQEASPFVGDPLKQTPTQGGPNSPSQSTPSSKPNMGTDEWHRVRRDNHKEVERRRRETINEGINELAKIVPGCEKNKGSILQRAVQFITQLKENESQNIEKWTLEKLLTEQAISELSASCDKFKAECQRAWTEADIYKRACEAKGIVPDEIRARAGEGAAST